MIVFKKYRRKPLDLQMLDIIIPRLPKERTTLLAKLKYDAARMQKGFNGERKLDYHLRQLSDAYDILCDVTLRWNKKPFQIDTLVITSRAIFIISVKSLEGIITFQPHNRTLIQEVNGEIHRYECPIVQAERHKAMLMKWLDVRNLSSLPIYFIIGIAEMSTTIHAENEHIKGHVQYVEYIPGLIQEINNRHLHHENITLQKKITHQVLQTTEAFYIDYLQKYAISKEEIQVGIVCKQCNTLGTITYKRKFSCIQCGVVPQEEVLQSLYDLMLLLNIDNLSNKQAMQLLQLYNRHQTWRLLKKSKLVKQNKSYKWYMPQKNNQ